MSIKVNVPKGVPRDVFKNVPVVGRGKTQGTRVLDRIDLRKAVYFCNMCRDKGMKLNYRKEDYLLLKDEQDLPLICITVCSGCRMQGAYCYTFWPREQIRGAWGPRYQYFTLGRK